MILLHHSCCTAPCTLYCTCRHLVDALDQWESFAGGVGGKGPRIYLLPLTMQVSLLMLVAVFVLQPGTWAAKVFPAQQAVRCT
jgi:hypothetical protein